MPEPAEQRVLERDGVVIVQYGELDVTNTAPPHYASLQLWFTTQCNTAAVKRK
jgi:hypothetical protein